MFDQPLQYHIDNIRLVSESTPTALTTRFLSAEPLANNIVSVTTEGAIDLSAVQIILNGEVCINVGRFSSNILMVTSQEHYHRWSSNGGPGGCPFEVNHISYSRVYILVG